MNLQELDNTITEFISAMNSFALKSTMLSLTASIVTISIASIEPVNAQTRTFLQPRLSPSGQPAARLDRCINSHRYPDSCGRAATQEVANRFCSRMGFRRAIQFSTIDRHWDQREWLWKYTEQWRDGNLERFWVLGEGGFMIEAIECGA
ncbi:hypothetical protein [Phormidium sp. FACHB-1136]|uniref:hypothetical protein n=1 Tax=Phormidium sp. FACHB-1136 TaxID=2692848 RepID=UPI0016832C3C|nr:hypothetical protein [Phormidium sp. FACHB-1136]MBD2428570.1 hypothetical protein [Phormidium sp. FACHB-1136]